jgi:hypothetical protein
LNQVLYHTDRQLVPDTLTLVIWEQIEEIDLPSIEGMARAFWSSRRHPNEKTLIILRHIDVLLALG